MYLAEAIKEKEFIESAISNLCDRITSLSVVVDDTVVKLNMELIKSKNKELEALYKELQKYTIIINRTKSKSVIVLNDENFSIADAENILDVMGRRLSFLELVLEDINRSNLDPKLYACVDSNGIENVINNLREDIKIIELSINKSLWSVEV